MINILFVFLCVVIFVVFAIVGIVLATNHLVNERFSYLDVDFTEEVGTTMKDQSYGEDPLQTYDLYLPADKSRENYSFILFIHGGGFTGGDKTDIEAVRCCEYLASKGYVVASANYRLFTEESAVYVIDMYEDLMTAAEVIVNHSEELGYHLNEMATTGGSAGGCLAMLMAYKEPERLPLPIKFVFQQTGPASFEPEIWDKVTDEDKAIFVNYVSGDGFTAADVGSAEYQKAIDEISVSTMINENSVPILLAYGPKDKVVAVNAKFLLLDALKENGVEHTYIEFTNSGHALFGDPDKAEEYYRTMEDYIDKYFTNH